jgi:murein DD-endopeptidase MepM/ murein hydrolase activator NlpD
VDNFDKANVKTYYRGSYGPPCKHTFMDTNKPGAGRHPGIDYGVGRGTPVKAIANGVIDLDLDLNRPNTRNCAGDDPKVQNNNGGWGGLVIIRHDCLGVYSIYAHLSNYSDKIWEAKRTEQKKILVKRGEIIGYSGGKGPWRGESTGYHLHFQIDKIGNNKIPWFPDWPTWAKERSPFAWWYKNECQSASPVNVPDDWRLYNSNDEQGGAYDSETNRNQASYPKSKTSYYKSLKGVVSDYTYDPIAFIRQFSKNNPFKVTKSDPLAFDLYIRNI